MWIDGKSRACVSVLCVQCHSKAQSNGRFPWKCIQDRVLEPDTATKNLWMESQWIFLYRCMPQELTTAKTSTHEFLIQTMSHLSESCPQGPVEGRMTSNLRAVVPAVLPPELCRELWFQHLACAVPGYRRGDDFLLKYR